MCLACHLQIFTDSKNILLIDSHHASSKPQDQVSLEKSFSHPNFNNFTLFHIINQNHHKSIFVVTKNDTILEIDVETMKLLRDHKIDACVDSMVSECEENIQINHISEISLLNQKMIWFCYIVPQSLITSPSLTNCIIPKNKILNTDLRWKKKRYTSDVNYHKTYSLQTEDYIFIGSFVDGYLSILRTKLPDILGRVDTSHDLITPHAEFYFETNSNFLQVFETEYEVYFLAVEPVTARSRSVSDCSVTSDSRMVYVTRLVRICKKDKGGVIDHNQYNFGSTAKADIVCPVGSGVNEFFYTRAVSASWSNSKLYILFESQRNSPPGQVLCYYDKFAFKTVFDGPIRQPWIHSESSNKIWNNPLPNVCEKLYKDQLNENSQITASSLSVNGLYRKLNILPVTKNPLLNIKNHNTIHIKSFPTGPLDNSTILVMTDEKFINIYSHTETNDLCDIETHSLKNQEVIHQISGSHFDFKLYLLLSTNQRIIKIRIDNCDKYIYKEKCLSEAPNICGWDQRTMTCTSLNSRVDLNSWQRSSCKIRKHHSTWSFPKLCHVNDSRISLTCLCRYCTDESSCPEGSRVQITNCSGYIEVGKWSEWESWSECSQDTGMKTRKRKCLRKEECLGKEEETKSCNHLQKTGRHSGWTQWYSISNTNIYNSFRAKCLTNKIEITPVLETREMFCENSCPGSFIRWSRWSNCETHHAQYRLFNCSSALQCPPNQIQIQFCEQISKKLLNHQNEKQNSYTFTHLVLVTLMASIIWLFILIFVSIVLVKFKLKYQVKEKRKTKQSLYRPSSIRFKREISETSNDYLSSDLKSTIYDLDHVDIMSFAHTDHNIPSTSENHYLQYPLITDQHTGIKPI